MCGLRTRPRTDVDPSRVEPPSTGGGAYRLAAPGAITCNHLHVMEDQCVFSYCLAGLLLPFPESKNWVIFINILLLVMLKLFSK